MIKTVMTTGGAEGFFMREKRVAQLADQGKPIPRERTISFEDPKDLARSVTTAKLLLFREVRGCPPEFDTKAHILLNFLRALQ